jgi:hypothetical protein
MSDDEFDSRDLERGESIERVFAVEVIEFEVPLTAHAEPVSAPAARSVESEDIAGQGDDEEATVETDVAIEATATSELFESVPLEFDKSLSSDAVAPTEAAVVDEPALSGDPSAAEPAEAQQADDAAQTLVAIPLSPWTGPSSKTSQNSEATHVAPVHWASGNGHDTAAPAHAPRGALPSSTPSSVEMFAPAEERVPFANASAPPAGFNARHVVLILLAVVVVAVAVSATVALLFERRFVPRPTASTSVDR